MATDCIFCKINSGEIPSEILYQDEEVIAFPDINPITPIHLLIISRKHIPSLADMADAEKVSHGYASKGREFYEFTYKKMVQVETDSGTIEIPQIVIVTIDKSTGEKFVSVSD